MSDEDPVITNPDHYRVLWENDRVRVLDYTDRPGTLTTAHVHPDSVMVTLSDFSRRLIGDDREIDVQLEAGQVVWLPAQRHAGLNIGETDTHTLLIELKGDGTPRPSSALGPVVT